MIPISSFLPNILYQPGKVKACLESSARLAVNICRLGTVWKCGPAKKLIIVVRIDELQTVANLPEQRHNYIEAAAATFKKDKRINIRISQKDLEALQMRALEEGLPYQFHPIPIKVGDGRTDIHYHFW